MIRLPPRSTLTDTLFPYTALFRSLQRVIAAEAYFKQGESGNLPVIGAGLQVTHQQLAGNSQLGALYDGALTQYDLRSEEHTSELQSLIRISYAVLCLKKKKKILHHIS